MPSQIVLASHNGVDPQHLLRVLAPHFHIEIGQGIHVNGLPENTWIVIKKETSPNA